MLNGWSKECLGIAMSCWVKVMDYWMIENPTPEYPLTWDGLCEMLEDVEYTEVAKELREAVEAAKEQHTL